MGKKPNAQEFLAAMQSGAEPHEVAPPVVSLLAPVEPAAPPPRAQPPKERQPRAKPARPTRAELKHFGGYVGDETLEKIALLRVRLKLDNSQLITHAIDDLHRKHTAKRAFGDA